MTATDIVKLANRIEVLVVRFEEALKDLNENKEGLKDLSKEIKDNNKGFNDRLVTVEKQIGNTISWRWVATTAVGLILSASVVFLGVMIGR